MNQKIARSTPRPPRSLGDSGRAYWRQVLTDWELEAYALPILEMACKTLDELEILEGVLKNPLKSGDKVAEKRWFAAEIRRKRVLFGTLVKQLDLGDEEARPASGLGRYARRDRDRAFIRAVNG
jgi:hypothetical protein